MTHFEHYVYLFVVKPDHTLIRHNITIRSSKISLNFIKCKHTSIIVIPSNSIYRNAHFELILSTPGFQYTRMTFHSSVLVCFGPDFAVTTRLPQKTLISTYTLYKLGQIRTRN